MKKHKQRTTLHSIPQFLFYPHTKQSCFSMSYYLVDHFNCYLLESVFAIGSSRCCQVRVPGIDYVNAVINPNLNLINLSFTRNIMVNELTVAPRQKVKLEPGEIITLGDHNFRFTRLVPHSEVLDGPKTPSYDDSSDDDELPTPQRVFTTLSRHQPVNIDIV